VPNGIGDEQVLFRIGDHGEFVTLLWPGLQGFERQLVTEDMGAELEGVGYAVTVFTPSDNASNI
jgi:hypothetical protein